MEKIRISRQGKQWLVICPREESETFREPPPAIVKAYDTYGAACAAAREMEPVIYGCAESKSRGDVAVCASREFLKDLPPFDPDAGRGDTIAVHDGSSMIFLTKAEAREMGFKVK